MVGNSKVLNYLLGEMMVSLLERGSKREGANLKVNGFRYIESAMSVSSAIIREKHLDHLRGPERQALMEVKCAFQQ